MGLCVLSDEMLIARVEEMKVQLAEVQIENESLHNQVNLLLVCMYLIFGLDTWSQLVYLFCVICHLPVC